MWSVFDCCWRLLGRLWCVCVCVFFFFQNSIKNAHGFCMCLLIWDRLLDVCFVQQQSENTKFHYVFWCASVKFGVFFKYVMWELKITMRKHKYSSCFLCVCFCFVLWNVVWSWCVFWRKEAKTVYSSSVWCSLVIACDWENFVCVLLKKIWAKTPMSSHIWCVSTIYCRCSHEIGGSVAKFQCTTTWFSASFWFTFDLCGWN